MNEAVFARADAYGILALCLQQSPPAELGRTLVQCGPAPFGEPALDTALARFAHCLEATSQATLVREYHRLLVGIDGGEVVPYASWHLAGHLMDRPLATLRRDLRRLGLERTPGCGEPEDHAAAICESMAALDLLDLGNDSERRAFFEMHVDSWLPRLFADLEQAAATDAYAELARLGQVLLAHERTHYAEMN
ncbi:MAG: molecular chaperone TorD family protein [Gammaproteobacteria bacterium]